MIKKLLIGAVVASILQFVWSGISYKALTWHQGTMESFKDEAAMVKALNANAPKPGIYVLPNPSPQNAPTDPEQKKAWEEKCKAMWAAGPVVFAAVSPGTDPSMKKQFGGALAIGALAGVVMTWLLFSVGLPGYWQRVRFVVTVALAAAVLINLPYMNWWGFTRAYTRVQNADLLISWAITGMALAKLTAGGKKKR